MRTVSNSGRLNEDDTFSDLGGMPGAAESYGAAVNNKGRIAGYAAFENDGSHAFLWNGTAFVELSPDGYRPGEALGMLGVNRGGTILGQGRLNGQPHYFSIGADWRRRRQAPGELTRFCVPSRCYSNS